MGRIERQSDSWNIVAKISDRIRIVAQAAHMAFHADAYTSSIGDRCELLKVLDLLVERGSMLAAWDRQRDDFRGFGQVADFFKAFVIRFALSVDFDVEATDVEAMGIAD